MITEAGPPVRWQWVLKQQSPTSAAPAAAAGGDGSGVGVTRGHVAPSSSTPPTAAAQKAAEAYSTNYSHGQAQEGNGSSFQDRPLQIGWQDDLGQLLVAVCLDEKGNPRAGPGNIRPWLALEQQLEGEATAPGGCSGSSSSSVQRMTSSGVKLLKDFVKKASLQLGPYDAVLGGYPLPPKVMVEGKAGTCQLKLSGANLESALVKLELLPGPPARFTIEGLELGQQCSRYLLMPGSLAVTLVSFVGDTTSLPVELLQGAGVAAKLFIRCETASPPEVCVDLSAEGGALRGFGSAIRLVFNSHGEHKLHCQLKCSSRTRGNAGPSSISGSGRQLGLELEQIIKVEVQPSSRHVANLLLAPPAAADAGSGGRDRVTDMPAGGTVSGDLARLAVVMEDGSSPTMAQLQCLAGGLKAQLVGPAGFRRDLDLDLNLPEAAALDAEGAGGGGVGDGEEMEVDGPPPAAAPLGATATAAELAMAGKPHLSCSCSSGTQLTKAGSYYVSVTYTEVRPKEEAELGTALASKAVPAVQMEVVKVGGGPPARLELLQPQLAAGAGLSACNKGDESARTVAEGVVVRLLDEWGNVAKVDAAPAEGAVVLVATAAIAGKSGGVGDEAAGPAAVSTGVAGVGGEGGTGRKGSSSSGGGKPPTLAARTVKAQFTPQSAIASFGPLVVDSQSGKGWGSKPLQLLISCQSLDQIAPLSLPLEFHDNVGSDDIKVHLHKLRNEVARLGQELQDLQQQQTCNHSKLAELRQQMDETIKAIQQILPHSGLNVPAEGASVVPFAQAAAGELQREMQGIRGALVGPKFDAAAQLLREGLKAFKQASPQLAGRVYGLVGELVKLPDARLSCVVSWKYDAVLRKVVVADHEARQALQQFMKGYIQQHHANQAVVRQACAADYLSFDTMHSIPQQMQLPHEFGNAGGGGGGRGGRGQHGNRHQQQLPPGQDAPQFVGAVAQVAETIPADKQLQLLYCILGNMLIISTQQQAVNYRRLLAGRKCGLIRSLAEGLEVSADGATRIDTSDNRAPASASQLPAHYGCVTAEQQPRYLQLQQLEEQVQQLQQQEQQVVQLQQQVAQAAVQLGTLQQERDSAETVLQEVMQELEVLERPRNTRARAHQQQQQGPARGPGAVGGGGGRIGEAPGAGSQPGVGGRMTRRSLSNQQMHIAVDDKDTLQQQRDQNAGRRSGAGAQGGGGLGAAGRGTPKRNSHQQESGNMSSGTSASKRQRVM